MSGIPVARVGDVTPAPGSVLISPAVSGTWSAGPVRYGAHGVLRVDGVPVIHEARCLFTFSGTGPSPANAPVGGTSDVTLSPPGPTVLKSAQSNVLRSGDTFADGFQNRLTAASTAHLLSG